MVKVRERPVPAGVNFSIRMNSELKTQSEDLFHALGMSLTMYVFPITILRLCRLCAKQRKSATIPIGRGSLLI